MLTHRENDRTGEREEKRETKSIDKRKQIASWEGRGGKRPKNTITVRASATWCDLTHGLTRGGVRCACRGWGGRGKGQGSSEGSDEGK